MKFSRRRVFVSLAAAAATAGVGYGARTASRAYYEGPVSDHFDGTRFSDPDGVPPKSIGDLIRWWGSRGKSQWPASYPSPYSDRPPARVDGAKLRVAFVGHASLLLQTGGRNLLLDPVWSDRVSPVSFAGPKRVNRPGIAFEALPKIDAKITEMTKALESLDRASRSSGADIGVRLQKTIEDLGMRRLGSATELVVVPVTARRHFIR